MRNISFSMTTPQFRARIKIVTRRMGWWDLMKGDILMGVEKSQGLKKGEKIVKLGRIRVVDRRSEKLNRMLTDAEYGAREVVSEGFPEKTPADFVEFFCKGHKGCKPHTLINRIEFEYMDEP